MHEFHSNTFPAVALAPQVGADNTALVTTVFDVKGFDFVELFIILGTVADADMTAAVALTHGDTADSPTAPTSITDAAAVDAACLVGSLSDVAFTFADDMKVERIGYSPAKGDGKQYLRATITPTGNSGNLPIAAMWLGKARQVPVAY